MVQIKGLRWNYYLFGLCALSTNIQSWKVEDSLTPIYEWNQIEFEYNSVQDRQKDIDSGFLVPGVPAIIDSDVYYLPNNTKRIFVTIPRFRDGSPATLGEITSRKYQGNYLIRPFPSWTWHRNPKQCLKDRIISVYRVQIDRCGRMWVLDNGKYGDDLICPPQILAFDPATGKLLHRYEIPQHQYEPRSTFVTPTIDVRETCQDTFVYAADCDAYSIVVHDTAKNQSWRVTDKTMYPYPSSGTYNIVGDTFDLMDGILGMSITPYSPGSDRKLFFHAMSSNTENWIYTSILRNNSASPKDFNVYRGRRSSQSAAEAIDKHGIMYFGIMSEVTFDCWDISSEYGFRNIKIVDDNKVTLQFASGVKVIDNKSGGQDLYVVTSRFQKIGAGTQNPNETNFRILTHKIDQPLIQKCKSAKHR